MICDASNRCRLCNHYMSGMEQCKYCEFELADDYPPTDDDKWDILDLDDNIEWGHLQIIDRLYYKGIECLSADIWYDNELAYIIGVKGSREEVAKALGINVECIFDDVEHSWMILNLFKEKCIRDGLL